MKLIKMIQKATLQVATNPSTFKHLTSNHRTLSLARMRMFRKEKTKIADNQVNYVQINFANKINFIQNKIFN